MPAEFTLADLDEPGYITRAICNACFHEVSLDLPALIATLGRDYPISRFDRRLRCSACGARWPTAHLMFAHDGRPRR